MCHISTPKHSRANELSQGETSRSPQRGISIGPDGPVGADCLNRDALRRHVLLRSANISQQRTDQVAGESPLTTATGARRTIVIDLDVLCCDIKVYGHAKRFVHRVWPRPHARLFLQTVSPHFRLAVWSRASAAHIDAALLALDPRKEFLPRRAPAPGASSAAAAEETLLPVAQLDLGGAMGRNHRHARTQNHSHAESGMEDLLVWDGDEEDADVSYEEEEGFCALDQEDDEEGDESESKGRQLAASASEGGHTDDEAGSRNTGVWTILDDGELVDPTDVVVLAADRATFGALQGSVIEVAPFDFNTSSVGTSDATGGPDDDVLVRLAAVLVRFMATAQATAPLPTPLPSQHQPWKPHGTASAVGAPAVASRTSVESDLQQLGLWGIRFGDTTGSQTTATAAAAPPETAAAAASAAAAAALGGTASSSDSATRRLHATVVVAAEAEAEGLCNQRVVGQQAAAAVQPRSPVLTTADVRLGMGWGHPRLSMLELVNLDSSSEDESEGEGEGDLEGEFQILGWHRLERRHQHAGMAGSLPALVPAGGGGSITGGAGAAASASRPQQPNVAGVRGRGQQQHRQQQPQLLQLQQPRSMPTLTTSRRLVRGSRSRMPGRSVSQLPPLIEEEEPLCEAAGGADCAGAAGDLPAAAAEGGARSPPSSPASTSFCTTTTGTTSISMPPDSAGVSRSGSQELQSGSAICTLDISQSNDAGARRENPAAGSAATTAAAWKLAHRSKSFGADKSRAQAPCFFFSRRHRNVVDATSASAAGNSPLPSCASLASPPLVMQGDACGSAASSGGSGSDSSGEGKPGGSGRHLAGQLRRLVSALQRSLSSSGSGPRAPVEAVPELVPSSLLPVPALSSCSVGGKGDTSSTSTNTSVAQPSDTAAHDSPLPPPQLRSGMSAAITSVPAGGCGGTALCADAALATSQSLESASDITAVSAVWMSGDSDQGQDLADARSSPCGFLWSAESAAAAVGPLLLPHAETCASSGKQSASAGPVAHLCQAVCSEEAAEEEQAEGVEGQEVLQEEQGAAALLGLEPASLFTRGRITAALFI